MAQTSPIPLSGNGTSEEAIESWPMRSPTDTTLRGSLSHEEGNLKSPQLYRNWSGLSRTAGLTKGGGHDGFSGTRRAKKIHGYPKLAGHLGQLRGNAIFRQFSALNARGLLDLHTEILELEEELHLLEEKNQRAQRGVQRSMHELRHANPGSSEGKQYEVMTELRRKLKEYNELVLQHADLNQLQKPSTGDVAELRCHIAMEHCDNPDPEGGDWWMDEREGSAWQIDEEEEVFESDLIHLSHSNDNVSDPFTRFLVSSLRWVISCQVFQRSSRSANGVMIEDRAILKWSRRISTVVASTLPSVSIFVLYYVPTIPWRLAFITLWSIFFSFCLTIFSSANTVQIFSASVGMAAVQVVFVGIGTP